MTAEERIRRTQYVPKKEEIMHATIQKSIKEIRSFFNPDEKVFVRLRPY